MQLLNLNKKILICSFLFVNLFANDSLDEKILSNDRNKIFDLTEKQIQEDSEKLKKDWINPASYTFTKNLGKEYSNSKSVLSIDQPIFKGGGIYKAITYADASKNYSKYSLEEQKKSLIKDAYNLLFSIKRLELNMQKTRLSVKNAQIDVIRKKEQVLSGVIDSSFLDNALLTLNNSKQSLVELKFQKKELINNFNNLASKPYTQFSLPKFSLVSKEHFLKDNIELKKINAQIEQADNFAYITMAKYLPSLNVFYSYTKNHDRDGNTSLEENSTQTYGLKVTVPLDLRVFNDMESKKIDYLKSKQELKNKQTQLENYFKTVLNTINMLDEKIEITHDDLKLYESILSIMEEEVEAQIKTQSDYDTLKNSQSIRNLDIEIYKMDKQIKLLELYSKIH
jgi:outer membrane protein TolC